MAAQVNNDGILDLVIGTTEVVLSRRLACSPRISAVSPSCWVRATAISPSSRSKFPSTYSRLAVADFTGNGPVDVFTTGANDIRKRPTRRVSWAKGTECSERRARSAANAVGTPFVGDFNNDGKPDVAVGSTLFIGRGGCLFQVQWLLCPDHRSSIRTPAVLNGDGNLIWSPLTTPARQRCCWEKEMEHFSSRSCYRWSRMAQADLWWT